MEAAYQTSSSGSQSSSSGSESISDSPPLLSRPLLSFSPPFLGLRLPLLGLCLRQFSVNEFVVPELETGLTLLTFPVPHFSETVPV